MMEEYPALPTRRTGSILAIGSGRGKLSLWSQDAGQAIVQDFGTAMSPALWGLSHPTERQLP